MEIKQVVFAAGLYAVMNISLATPLILVKTTQGDIEIELNEKAAPITTKNFMQYVHSGFYSNTIFHRVIPGFMIQGGGFDTAMKEKKTKTPIQNEAENGLKNVRGSIAMARMQAKDSANSQFFINLVDNPALDYSTYNDGYAVFGKVSKGMEIVDKISKQPTMRKGIYADVPQQSIRILEIKVVKAK